MADLVSIFKDGKLKPGIYKIQNIVGQTYLEVRDHSKQLCCRSATALKDGNGLVSSRLSWSGYHVVNYLQWEIRHSGPGYTIRRVRLLIAFQFNRGMLNEIT